jgi:hypothetical protein
MIEASAIQAPTMRPFALRMGRGYVDSLEDALSITEPQMGAWMSFAEALLENRRRMESVVAGDQPFGALEDRLAALRRMRTSAAKLFPLLDPAQQGLAMRHLPLCCLPKAAS